MEKALDSMGENPDPPLFSQYIPLKQIDSFKQMIYIFIHWIFLRGNVLQVNCDAIFDSDEIDRPNDGPPVPWDQIPEPLQVGGTPILASLQVPTLLADMYAGTWKLKLCRYLGGLNTYLLDSLRT